MYFLAIQQVGYNRGTDGGGDSLVFEKDRYWSLSPTVTHPQRPCPFGVPCCSCMNLVLRVSEHFPGQIVPHSSQPRCCVPPRTSCTRTGYTKLDRCGRELRSPPNFESMEEPPRLCSCCITQDVLRLYPFVWRRLRPRRHIVVDVCTRGTDFVSARRIAVTMQACRVYSAE